MSFNPRHAFRDEGLDANLLSTPFKVQTNWHVITGAPCTGKTTLLELLAEKGFQTVAETARQYFEEELAKGRTLGEMHEDQAALQLGIKELQVRTERGVRPAEVAFLDRALPDSLTFHRLFGLDPNEYLHECFFFRYASVFILDRLPFARDKTLGPEDDTSANFVDEWLPRDYSALGYKVVRVPVLTPEERLAFVLGSLSERRLI